MNQLVWVLFAISGCVMWSIFIGHFMLSLVRRYPTYKAIIAYTGLVLSGPYFWFKFFLYKIGLYDLDEQTTTTPFDVIVYRGMECVFIYTSVYLLIRSII